MSVIERYIWVFFVGNINISCLFSFEQSFHLRIHLIYWGILHVLKQCLMSNMRSVDKRVSFITCERIFTTSAHLLLELIGQLLVLLFCLPLCPEYSLTESHINALALCTYFWHLHRGLWKYSTNEQRESCSAHPVLGRLQLEFYDQRTGRLRMAVAICTLFLWPFRRDEIFDFWGLGYQLCHRLCTQPLFAYQSLPQLVTWEPQTPTDNCPYSHQHRERKGSRNWLWCNQLWWWQK